MIELKCPIHNMPLEECIGYDGDYCCRECGSNVMYGSEELWQTLINTKKKLDIAITELKNVVEDDDFDIYMRQLSAQTTLEQINQKEENNGK